MSGFSTEQARRISGCQVNMHGTITRLAKDKK
jgi:hypothetical protein